MIFSYLQHSLILVTVEINCLPLQFVQSYSTFSAVRLLQLKFVTLPISDSPVVGFTKAKMISFLDRTSLVPITIKPCGKVTHN